MSTIQLDFFAKTEEQLCLLELGKTRDELANLRRGMFSRHGELYKTISELEKTIKELKDEINTIKKV